MTSQHRRGSRWDKKLLSGEGPPSSLATGKERGGAEPNPRPPSTLRAEPNICQIPPEGRGGVGKRSKGVATETYRPPPIRRRAPADRLSPPC